MARIKLVFFYLLLLSVAVMGTVREENEDAKEDVSEEVADAKQEVADAQQDAAEEVEDFKQDASEEVADAPQEVADAHQDVSEDINEEIQDADSDLEGINQGLRAVQKWALGGHHVDGISDIDECHAAYSVLVNSSAALIMILDAPVEKALSEAEAEDGGALVSTLRQLQAEVKDVQYSLGNVSGVVTQWNYKWQDMAQAGIAEGGEEAQDALQDAHQEVQEYGGVGAEAATEALESAQQSVSGAFQHAQTWVKDEAIDGDDTDLDECHAYYALMLNTTSVMVESIAASLDQAIVDAEAGDFEAVTAVLTTIESELSYVADDIGDVMYHTNTWGDDSSAAILLSTDGVHDDDVQDAQEEVQDAQEEVQDAKEEVKEETQEAVASATDGDDK